MAESWLDFEAISSDRPISSAITIAGWRGNLDRTISQSGYFCSAAYQLKTVLYQSGAVINTRFSKITSTEIPALIRSKEDGDTRDLKVRFKGYTSGGNSCVVRVDAYGSGVRASAQTTVTASTAVTTSTVTITGISPGRIIDEYGAPSGAPQNEPSVVWISFHGQLAAGTSDSLSIQEITVEELP